MILFRRLCTVALLLCALVVVFGAYVRLSDAGLGCPDWPGCYGQLTVPEQSSEAYERATSHPARPLEAGKAWKEMIHRYLASTLGLLIVAMALLSTLRPVPGMPRKLPWLLVALVIFQGVLGMWTVTWLLKPAIVTAHLLGGMSILALLSWLRLSIAKLRPPRPASALIRRTAVVALLVTSMQLFLGGWTSTNYAALACPDFPTCQNQWLPDTDAGEAYRLWRGLGTNYEFGVLDNRQRVTVHYFHRVGAVVLTGVLLFLSLLLFLHGWRAYGSALLLALFAQVAIGISIVLKQLPLMLATAHNAGAALLLLTVVALTHAAWTTTPAES